MELKLIIIPAIDLRNGKCVRLIQGDFKRETIYSDNPLDVAGLWQSAGAERIHVVDLDGSLSGLPRNQDTIKRMVSQARVPVQVGGGIRDIRTIGTYIDMGVRWVVLGTAAMQDRALMKAACAAYNGHIILAIDAIDGMVSIKGWTERTAESAIQTAKFYEGYGLEAVIYTDIARDGMECGPNIEKTAELARSVSIPVIASGGVSGIRDIEKLLEIQETGVMGVIVGKALYTGALSLKDAIDRAKHRV
jgi:phosphoribosylformimino-5-aminoimidazole carboxamide ribotide isomerase